MATAGRKNVRDEDDRESLLPAPPVGESALTAPPGEPHTSESPAAPPTGQTGFPSDTDFHQTGHIAGGSKEPDTKNTQSSPSGSRSKPDQFSVRMPSSADDPKRKQYVKKTEHVGLGHTTIDVAHSPSDSIEMESFTPHGEGKLVDDVLVPLLKPESPSSVDSTHCPHPVEAIVVIQPPISSESPADPKPTGRTKDIPTTTAKNVPPSAAPKHGPESQNPQPKLQGSLLTDAHVWELAQRIISEEQVQDLGLKVLKLQAYQVDAAVYNEKTIQLAALKILKIWKVKQVIPKEIYRNLFEALTNNGFKNLAGQLRTWVEGVTAAPLTVEAPVSPPVAQPGTAESTLGAAGGHSIPSTSFQPLVAGTGAAGGDLIPPSTASQSGAAALDPQIVNPSQGPELHVTDRDGYIRTCLKESLINRYENFMSTDWLPQDETRRFPSLVYTEPHWTRTVGHLWVRREEMNHLYDIFHLYKDGSVVLVEGGAGSGKSSAAAKLALDWAKEDNTTDQSHGTEDTSQSQGADVKHSQDASQAEKLKNKFDFVFLIPLKHIDADVPLEQVILQEHGLQDKNITQDEIKEIIDSPRSLLIFDGYDEYQKGTNSAIDAAISGERGKPSVLITSRPGHMDKKDKKKVDGQIQNNGLTRTSIKTCTERYLEDEEKADDFLKEAKRKRVFDILRLPMLLVMTCVLFLQTDTLPKNRGKIVQDITNMYILRARERGVHLEDTDQILLALGELSYEASQRDSHKLHIRKSDVENKCSDILKLGLLQGDMSPQKEDTGLRKQPKPEWMTFPHKMFQDFVSAFYIEKQGKDGLNLLYLPFTWMNLIRRPRKVLIPYIPIVDDDVLWFVLETTQHVWLYRYNETRRLVMVNDRIVDVGAVVLFVWYHIKSTPHWEVCIGVYIILRLLTLALLFRTNLCERYAVRTVLLYAVSWLCWAAFLAPAIAGMSDGWLVIVLVCGLALVLALVLAFYLGRFIWIYRKSRR